jgi:N6-adenosine-specific RNA methylase IME4
MTNAIELRFQKELAKTPDPVEFALTFPKRMAQAIAAAKKPEEANEIRALASMGTAYLKQALPRVVQERHERFSLMHPTEMVYIKASAKAGALWAVTENKKSQADNQYASALEPKQSVQDAGFKDPRDATRCVRVASLHEEDIRTYENETFQEETHATVTGAERIWLMMQENEPDPLSGKYRVIYADPPWSYGNTMSDEATQPDTHYNAIDDKRLAKMNVKDIAEDDAVMFLWVTSPKLEDCFPIIKAWGFEYKSAFIWDKVKHNMGHYNSVRHELLLICTRGSCMPDVPKLVDSVQTIERGEHSAKPEEFRNIIDELYPRGKRIELFARKKADGWDNYGNEIP